MLELLADWWRRYLIHAADILLVAALLYQVLVLVQGTRAVQVLRGLIILYLLSFIVERFVQLAVFGWLLRAFWVGWAVILAVVFQPEIRSLLAQLGSRRLGRLLLPQELRFVDEILPAMKEAVKSRTGMLIVLEQETGLRNFIETGTVLDAEVSSDLLLTLFHPRTLLHDGAVIIREDRVVAAACVLPVSNDPTLSRVMGTRHRAALGVTEISDAVVLVVSEETGTVSVMREGRVERDVALKELGPRLRDFYRSMGERGLLRRGEPRGGGQ
jgi:diadenylate cyclase